MLRLQVRYGQMSAAGCGAAHEPDVARALRRARGVSEDAIADLVFPRSVSPLRHGKRTESAAVRSGPAPQPRPRGRRMQRPCSNRHRFCRGYSGHKELNHPDGRPLLRRNHPATPPHRAASPGERVPNLRKRRRRRATPRAGAQANHTHRGATNWQHMVRGDATILLLPI